VDPFNGRNPVKRAFITADLFPGVPLPPTAPDMIVGYNRGYRCSWETTLGAFPEEVITPNTDPWSGDHCSDPSVCPGTLISSAPVREGPALTDMGGIISELLEPGA